MTISIFLNYLMSHLKKPWDFKYVTCLIKNTHSFELVCTFQYMFKLLESLSSVIFIMILITYIR